jgi:hypothetical protein
MPRNPNISLFAGTSGALYMTDAAIKSQIVGSFKHGHLEVNLRDSQDRERRIEMLGQTGSIGFDSFLRPLTEIDVVLGRQQPVLWLFSTTILLKFLKTQKFRSGRNPPVYLCANVDSQQQHPDDKQQALRQAYDFHSRVILWSSVRTDAMSKHTNRETPRQGIIRIDTRV